VAAELMLDRVIGTDIDVRGNFARYTRGGYAKGLPVVAGNEHEMLWSIMSIPNCPRAGDTLPGHPALYFANFQATPLGGSHEGGQARCRFVYETPQSLATGVTPTSYVITSGVHSVGYQTDLIPGTRVPIRTGDFVSTDFPDARVPADNVLMNITRAHRVLRVSALRLGDPDDDKGDLVDHVNDGQWRGKGIGFWKLSGYETSVSKYGGYYQLAMEAESRVFEDWSETGLLEDRLSGKKVPVTEPDIAIMMGLPYAYGVIFPRKPKATFEADHEAGLVRAGPYPLTNFNAIFGFS
jgi:hypothetical protein